MSGVSRINNVRTSNQNAFNHNTNKKRSCYGVFVILFFATTTVLTSVICLLWNRLRELQNEHHLDFAVPLARNFQKKSSSPQPYDCKMIEAMNLGGPESSPRLVTIKPSSSSIPPFQMSIKDPSTDLVSQRIRDIGCWECSAIQQLEAIMKQYHDPWFLDVGAHIGVWTLAIAAAGYPTVAVEPRTVNWHHLCESLNYNLEFPVRLYPVAVTLTKGPFDLDVFNNNSDKTADEARPSRFLRRDGDKLTSADSVVNGFPLDDILADLPINRPMALKLDVAGKEVEVLQSAAQLIPRSNIIWAHMQLRSESMELLRATNNSTNNTKGSLSSEGGDGDADEHTSSPRLTAVFRALNEKGLRPYRQDRAGKETLLDIDSPWTWRHFRHPIIMRFDVIWRP